MQDTSATLAGLGDAVYDDPTDDELSSSSGLTHLSSDLDSYTQDNPSVTSSDCVALLDDDGMVLAVNANFMHLAAVVGDSNAIMGFLYMRPPLS